MTAVEDTHENAWLLLAHQLPAKPAYLRVKIWRRLQALGAVAVRNAVYALPASDEAREDFDWVMREVVDGGGSAFVCEATLVAGLSDSELRRMFHAARDADYQALGEEAKALLNAVGQSDADDAAHHAELARLRGRAAQIAEIDFFGADGGSVARGLLAEVEARMTAPTVLDVKGVAARGELVGRTWVTRAGVRVDRIATGWLVRRFVDPLARFRFVAGKDAPAAEGEIRFDMYAGEFTHAGDRCTFEVLLDHLGLDDPALRAIAEIVHDIDLKDGKFARPETDGVRMFVNGVCLATADDEERMSRGAALFDDLHRGFGAAA